MKSLKRIIETKCGLIGGGLLDFSTNIILDGVTSPKIEDIWINIYYQLIKENNDEINER
jgi:hypothetical protein